MKKKKVALVGFHMYGGGTARVMANLSNFFDKKNIEVHNIIIHDEIGYEYSGELYNLGKLKSKSNTIFNKIKRFNALKKYIKQQDFDFVIDFRFRKRILQEYMISKFIYEQKKTIYTIHSSQLEIYLSKSRFWTQLIYGKAYRVIAITKAMKEMVEKKYPKLKNVSMIYNPVIHSVIEAKKEQPIDLDFEYVIGVGHFDTDQKQFDKLIESYAESKLPKNQVHLVILGKGKKQLELEHVAEKMYVKNKVHFLGFQDNPYKFMKNAKAFVLSSWHEGHPMVLIEALCCNIPAIAFGCPTGPREVINHKENGLLIEDQNLEELTKGLNLMILDEALYKKCKDNSLKSVEKFSLNVIGNQWLDVMNFKN
ncbi:glycosyltransferase [Pontimicrobium aquaticum]|uniref:Glycosyltransferase n=1 Tax=Pontimicrobium aquaticum TaxID=2565367 RepID=A0A4V5LQS8_9FLAO|nr:glycosyltransferase [Pontimicrobium aquaticum]TJY36399.1 glycosyltransferase [Pontimicrobium aquaticum]